MNKKTVLFLATFFSIQELYCSQPQDNKKPTNHKKTKTSQQKQTDEQLLQQLEKQREKEGNKQPADQNPQHHIKPSRDHNKLATLHQARQHKQAQRSAEQGMAFLFQLTNNGRKSIRSIANRVATEDSKTRKVLDNLNQQHERALNHDKTNN